MAFMMQEIQKHNAVHITTMPENDLNNRPTR